MSIIYLTTFALDMIGGAAIWTITKTYNGVYYLLYGSNDNTISIDKTMLDNIVNDNKDYRDKIKKLENDIDCLSKYVKDIKK